MQKWLKGADTIINKDFYFLFQTIFNKSTRHQGTYGIFVSRSLIRLSIKPRKIITEQWLEAFVLLI